MTGNHWTLIVDNDSAIPADAAGKRVEQQRRRYAVTAAAGLFKNGQHYAPGDAIELSEQSAAEFLRLEEIEPA